VPQQAQQVLELVRQVLELVQQARVLVPQVLEPGPLL
jgi:hypothetical protein